MRAIVITSIFPPTEAVEKFGKLQDYCVYVVGDLKTPSDWSCRKVRYVSVDEQKLMTFQLLKGLPYNHYCRKMIGYLLAIRDGATEIIDTDDDNIPYDNWGFPQFEGEFSQLDSQLGFVNIYQYFTEEKIWPRGLPLRLINSIFEIESKASLKDTKVGVWQGLADEDPDVDAIYRLTSDKPCYFEKKDPIVLGKGTVCPFNTQNTLIRKELFPLLYLPTFVTFRYTDILRGLIAQPIMWAAGYTVGFTNATVIQKRNPHDYMRDFVSEIPMYETCEKVVELVCGAINEESSIPENLLNAYEALLSEGIVEIKEVQNLKYWLNDLKSNS